MFKRELQALTKVSFEPNPAEVFLSYVRVKFWLRTIIELTRSSHYDSFESNSERDIKSVFQIDY